MGKTYKDRAKWSRKQQNHRQHAMETLPKLPRVRITKGGERVETPLPDRDRRMKWHWQDELE